MGRILKRCDVCKRFHAAYVVEDPLYPGGKANYCLKCWKKKFGDASPSKEQSGEKSPESDAGYSDPKGLKDP